MGATPAVSVIIPTYNRRATLERALDHLAAQTVGPDALQVIVCDDGSTDDTRPRLAEGSWPFTLDLLTQANAGPAAARNRALRVARAPYVLFVNDDTLLAPDTVERHLARHDRHRNERLMVLGTFDLPPAFVATRLGYLLTHTDRLFQYCLLHDGDLADYNFAYTCNLSLPTEAAKSVGFDERFTGPAGEDIDFGRALHARGWSVLFDASARAEHDHTMTVRSLIRTARTRGHGQAVYYRKHGISPEARAHLRDIAARRESLEAAVLQTVPALESSLERVPWSDAERIEDRIYDWFNALFHVTSSAAILDDPRIRAEVAA